MMATIDLTSVNTASIICRSLEKEPDMDGILLIIAGGFEIASAIGLEYTDGFTRAVPTVVIATAMVASFSFSRRR